MTSEFFDREFTASDEAVFGELVAGMIGQPLSAWFELYPTGVSLYLGRLSSPPAEKPYLVKGEWVISSSGADILVRGVDATPLADSRQALEQVVAILPDLVGAVLREATIRSDDLSLVLVFSNEMEVTFLSDPEVEEIDQWALQIPWDTALVTYNGRRWRLEANPRTPW